MHWIANRGRSKNICSCRVYKIFIWKFWWRHDANKKSIARESGIQMYDFTKETVGNIETAGFISKGIFEADMFLKNQKFDKKISQNNVKLDYLTDIEIKGVK